MTRANIPKLNFNDDTLSYDNYSPYNYLSSNILIKPFPVVSSILINENFSDFSSFYL